MNTEKPIFIFIDSNIFLNFYDFYSEDLEKLSQLIDLVKKGKIKIFTTTQVIQEVFRNREIRLAEAYSKFQKSKVFLEMPVICQAYPEYEKIKKIQKELNEIKGELSKKLWEDIISKSLKADKMISKIFEIAEKIDSTKFLERAKIRYLVGNPPGKKDGTYGDELNWEALLECVPNNKNFVIISDDQDYRSPLKESELKEFLINEWEERKKSKITLYRTLTSFFKDFEINIELRWEEEKDKLIKALIESHNFATTHDIIAKLSKFINFSETQIKNLGSAAILNSQVNWIAQDTDIKEFYEKYVLSHLYIFSEEDQEKLREIFYGKGKTEIEEIPF